ncbi:vWA domain-containing protein [Actibacterium mucosum]|nr:vWA domain-containing protein [Actibacterium mucosum]
MPLSFFRPAHAAALSGIAALAACDPALIASINAGMTNPVVVAEDVLAEPELAIIEPEPPTGRVPAPRAGVITAGDIDDTLNLGAFGRFASRARRELNLPLADLRRPILLQLTGPDGRPAPGARVTLRKPGAADPFYSGYAAPGGYVTVFPSLFGQTNLSKVEVRTFDDAQQGAVQSHIVTLNGSRERLSIPHAQGWTPEFLDLLFVVDTTGSMGDELAWLTKDLRRIVRTAQKAAPKADIRYGLVVYRDRQDAYTVRNFGFTKSQRQMVGWLRAQTASGGGDYPEAAAAGLQAGVDLNWRRGKGERLLFHIADAPPHDHEARAYLHAAQAAAKKGVQVFGLGASGVGIEAEFLMRQAAVQTGGRYLFLTDDSGVGYGHAEPSISCYRVTDLSGLVTRVLRSELDGIRHEAPASDIIRSVGSYRGGVCSD